MEEHDNNAGISMSRSMRSELAATRKPQTAPEDRISLAHKLIYGLGAFINNLLAAAIGGMAVVLNIGLGMNPALVGLLGALPRLTDALTDPLMGYISDNTRSRWGRRRPYIFCGAILSGVFFALLWQLPLGMSENFYFWFFLIGSFIFYIGYTIFATPWVALGYELTPDYHERTRLMAVQNFMGQFAYMIAPWFVAIMSSTAYFTDIVSGASYVAIAIGLVTIVVGILPAIYLKERFAHPLPILVPTEANKPVEKNKSSIWQAIATNMREFFHGFAQTLKIKPFLLLCTATFLVFNGFMLISAFSFYVIVYYVCGGDIAEGAKISGLAGSIGAVSTFIVIFGVTWLSTILGKRQAFFIAMVMSIVGYMLKWVCYHPDYPYLAILPAPFIAFGLGALFTLMGSMIADVCDLDELESHERREGMFGSIYWWVVKLGMALALAGGGYLLNATGFDVDLKGDQTADAIFWMRFFDVLVPIMATLIAMWAIYKFPISEARAKEIRDTLESRRGSLSAAV